MPRNQPSHRYLQRNASLPNIVVSRSSIRRTRANGSPMRPSTTRLKSSESNANTPHVSPVRTRQHVSTELQDGGDVISSRSVRSHKPRTGVSRRGRNTVEHAESSSKRDDDCNQRSSSRNRNNRPRRSRSLNERRTFRSSRGTMPAKNGRKSQSLITNESIRDSFNSTKLNNDSAKDISSGIVGDLSAFLAQNASVSRRKRTSGGAKSVGGLPGRPISKSEKKGNVRRGRRTSAQASGSNLRPAKPASVPIFVIDSLEAEMEEASDIDSENEGESNDIGMIVEDHLDNDKNISRDRNMENAIQLHMSRTDNLLFSVFPRHIAEDLRAGRKVEPQNHEIVTIFFSDIVGFTDISSKMDALKISDMLDRLYHSFDALSHYHDVFKVETIGDAYMAVTNLAEQQPDHCKRIAEFSIDAIRVAKQTLVDKDDSSKGFVNIRVGFHSGPVVSSVVGSRNPRYCLFGDTVNTASRMESNSAPNSIHCSDISAKLLQEQSPQMRLFPRGVINVKGKGNMKTFWVNEEREKEDEHSMKSGNGGHRSFFKSFKVK